MTNIAVPVPPSLQRYSEHLREFFSGMCRKLDMNSHKSTPERAQIQTIVEHLRREVEEFEEQLAEDPKAENALVELFDTSNFAFLAFVALRNNGTKTKRERLIDEFLTIDPVAGKVFCKKTRAGSQYKIGQEIKGTRRAGYIDIKLQSRRDAGTSVAVPRSHLVWWKSTGRWPIGVVDHDNRVRDDDRIENLKDKSFSDNALNHGKERKWPSFVTRYMPTGREHLASYGKFIYQRHHNGINIRCAYFDTPEAAAEAGAIAWLETTKRKEA